MATATRASKADAGLWRKGGQTDWSGGIVRDSPRTGIPDRAVYDSADFMLDRPGLAYKRGGTTYAGPALTGAAYTSAVSYAEFPAGSKLIGIGDNGHLYTITAGTTTDVSTLGTGFPPVDKPKLSVSTLVIPAADGTTAPKKYDGTTVANLGGTPPAGKYAVVYKGHLYLASTAANPNRIFASPIPNIEDTWDTANAYMDADYSITGVTALNNALVVFSAGHTELFVGSVPPPDPDFNHQPLGATGCTDARSIAVGDNAVIFANTGGIYLTSGAAPECITDKGGIGAYWRSLLVGYVPSTWVISGELHSNRYYFVNVLNASGTLVAFLICDVPRRAWWRVTNVRGVMFARAVGVAQEVYYADRSTNRVGQISGFFTPAAGNKNDANGTAVTPLLETRLFGGSLTLHQFGMGELSYDMTDAASDDPTLAVSTAAGVEATTFAAVAESPLTETTDETRKRFTIAKISQGVTLRFQQTNASAKTEIYGLELEQRELPPSAGGQ